MPSAHPAHSHRPGRGLSRRQRRVLRATAEALFFDGERSPPGERLDWLVADLDDYLRAVAGTTRFVLALAVITLQFSPLWTLGRPRRLTGLSVDRRLRCMHRLERSRFALFALLIGVAKVMLAMVYFEHPEALVETGYDGQCAHGPNPAGGLPLTAGAAAA